jgi:predicted metal-dependent peptidase
MSTIIRGMKCKVFTGASETAVRMMLHHPWMMVLYYSMAIFEYDGIPTLATNGVSMWVNPAFWAQLSRNQKVTAMAHEIGHKMLLHTARVGSRDMRIWNIAGDHVINLMLTESGFEPLHKMTIDGRPWMWFCDKKFTGMTTEAVYEILRQEYQDKETEEGEGEGEGGGDSEGDGDGTGSSTGKGKGKGRTAGEIAEKDLGASADVLEYGDSPDGVDGTDGEGEGGASETIAEFEQRVRKELKESEQMSKMAGNTPSWFDRVIGYAEKSKVKWYEILEEQLTTLRRADYAWYRWNRRGLIMTGTIMPDMYEPSMGGLEVYVDCSGSCWSALDAFNQHFKAMVEQLKPTFVRVKYFQTYVMDNLTHRFEHGEFEVELRPSGGGGTSFAWLKDSVENEEEIADAVIVLTDMYGDFGHAPDNVPVFWVSVSDEDKAPFGEVVNV